MSVTRGRDYHFYRNTDDPYDNSPTWSLVTNIRDLTRNIEKVMADASTRVTEWGMQVGVKKEFTANFQMVDDGGADALAFEDAFYEDTDIEIAMLNGPISTSGSRGFRAMIQVSKFTVNEALEDVGLIDVSVVIAYNTTNLPRRVSSNGSILVDA